VKRGNGKFFQGLEKEGGLRPVRAGGGGGGPKVGKGEGGSTSMVGNEKRCVQTGAVRRRGEEKDAGSGPLGTTVKPSLAGLLGSVVHQGKWELSHCCMANRDGNGRNFWGRDGEGGTGGEIRKLVASKRNDWWFVKKGFKMGITVS